MDEPFIILSEGSFALDSASDSFDDLTPLSTPCSATHDTSRAGFHKKDLESFAKDLQTAADRAFPNDGRNQPRYRSVSVLLLRWEDDEMNVEWELDDLEKVFMRYGYNTERWLIPTKNSHLKLMSKAIDVVEDHDGKDDLVIVYYAGHAYINAARQATWCCKRDRNYASLEWSAIQTLFAKAQLDVLLLLDCCAAASAAPTIGLAITETIAACGFESIAPQPGRYSFTNTLIEVLEDWVNGKSFSAAMLHNEVLSRLKHEQPVRTQSGPRGTRECRSTPIFIVATSDPRLPSIELGRRALPAMATTILKNIPDSSKDLNTGDTLEIESPPATEPPVATDGPSLKRKRYEQEDVNETTDHKYKISRVIISLALNGNQSLDESEACQKWLASYPALVKFAKVEAVFESFSTLVLISLPIFIWNMLPDDPACAFVGYITSPNMLCDHAVAPISTPLQSTSGVEFISEETRRRDNLWKDIDWDGCFDTAGTSAVVTSQEFEFSNEMCVTETEIKAGIPAVEPRHGVEFSENAWESETGEDDQAASRKKLKRDRVGRIEPQLHQRRIVEELEARIIELQRDSKVSNYVEQELERLKFKFQRVSIENELLKSMCSKSYILQLLQNRGLLQDFASYKKYLGLEDEDKSMKMEDVKFQSEDVIKNEPDFSGTNDTPLLPSNKMKHSGVTFQQKEEYATSNGCFQHSDEEQCHSKTGIESVSITGQNEPRDNCLNVTHSGLHALPEQRHRPVLKPANTMYSTPQASMGIPLLDAELAPNILSPSSCNPKVFVTPQQSFECSRVFCNKFFALVTELNHHINNDHRAYDYIRVRRPMDHDLHASGNSLIEPDLGDNLSNTSNANFTSAPRSPAEEQNCLSLQQSPDPIPYYPLAHQTNLTDNGSYDKPSMSGRNSVMMDGNFSERFLGQLQNQVHMSNNTPILPQTSYQRPKHVRVHCNRCDDHPEGFRGPHELTRHIDNNHSQTTKKFICVEPQDSHHLKPLVPLSKCKSCTQQKKYGVYYNAAAHLRRAHFNPKPKGRIKGANSTADRGSGGRGGDLPMMDELKQWMQQVEVSIVEDAADSAAEDQDVASHFPKLPTEYAGDNNSKDENVPFHVRQPPYTMAHSTLPSMTVFTDSYSLPNKPEQQFGMRDFGTYNGGFDSFEYNEAKFGF